MNYPFPSMLINEECTIVCFAAPNQNGVSSTAATVTKKCYFEDSTKKIYDSQGKKVASLSLIIIEGDIPELNEKESGTATVRARLYSIEEVKRIYNTDQSVYSIELRIK